MLIIYIGKSIGMQLLYGVP